MGKGTEPDSTGTYAACLLECDPGFGDRLSREQFRQASRRLRVPVVRCPRGDVRGWPLEDAPEAGFQGFVVLKGLLSRTVTLGNLHASELLGPGDVVRPWDGQYEDLLQVRSCWRVREAAEIAVLDRQFHALAAAWPEIAASLHDRDATRAASLTTRLLIAQAPRITHRVHLLLWHLGGRWGFRSSAGVIVPLRLSRTLVADLVCSTRESVSRAMTVLVAEGTVEPIPRGFLLHGSPPGAVASSAQRNGNAERRPANPDEPDDHVEEHAVAGERDLRREVRERRADQEDAGQDHHGSERRFDQRQDQAEHTNGPAGVEQTARYHKSATFFVWR